LSQRRIAPKKKRKKSDEIAFEKHYGEPLTEQEHEELADLIASIIVDSWLKRASSCLNDHPPWHSENAIGKPTGFVSGVNQESREGRPFVLCAE
jgi:hypothetical protein